MTDHEVLATAASWLAAGKDVALATVVQTWGSAPRAVGSHLTINDSGAFVGSVSGGCIEGAVVDEALEAIRDGKPRQLEFGVSNEQAWEVGLACGGTIRIYVEPLVRRDPLHRLLADLVARQAVARVTRIADGAQVLVRLDAAAGDFELPPQALAETRNLLARGHSAQLTQSDRPLFARSYPPPLRLIIIGAVHISQTLAPMAALAGFEVVVSDPRRAFATVERFPGVTLSEDWPHEALRKLVLDDHCAVVAVTHDPKFDDLALVEALNSPAFYIGALGSQRTHARRVERLTELGLAASLPRIRAPVGLDLGGRSPAEIAVSILAEMIQTYHKGSGL